MYKDGQLMVRNYQFFGEDDAMSNRARHPSRCMACLINRKCERDGYVRGGGAASFARASNYTAPVFASRPNRVSLASLAFRVDGGLNEQVRAASWANCAPQALAITFAMK